VPKGVFYCSPLSLFLKKKRKKSLLYKHIQAWLLKFNMHHCFSFSFLPTKHKIIFYYVERKKREKKKKEMLQKVGKKQTKHKLQVLASYSILQVVRHG